MSGVTLDLVQARQCELAEMIQQLQAQQTIAAETTIVSLSAVEISLHAGEHYAGTVLDDDGRVTHHLILLPDRPAEDLIWKDAMKWASELDADLPSPQEQSLLYANCKKYIPQRWCWSNKSEGDKHAWYCYFDDGYQYFYPQSNEGCAVAVRRVNP